MIAVLLLAGPYFYDELVGLPDRRAALLLEVATAACACRVMLDVGGFLYRRYRRKSAHRGVRRP